MQDQSGRNSVLDRRRGERQYEEGLLPVPPDLLDLVGHCWCVSWDLRGHAPYTQRILPHPSNHFVVEAARSRIVCVSTEVYAYTFHGSGRIFGIAFRPASFRLFLGKPVASILNQELPIESVFGIPGQALAEELLGIDNNQDLVDVTSQFLRGSRPEMDPLVEKLNQLVNQITTDRQIVRVEQAAERFGVSRRTLERLFNDYVGVSPKWVIRRYRLHEAAGRLANESDLNLAVLAQELGYFDQSHFTREFTRVVGRPPGAYAKDQV
jgi:AraC-like DNA-binding protein